MTKDDMNTILISLMFLDMVAIILTVVAALLDTPQTRRRIRLFVERVMLLLPFLLVACSGSSGLYDYDYSYDPTSLPEGWSLTPAPVPELIVPHYRDATGKVIDTGTTDDVVYSDNSQLAYEMFTLINHERLTRLKQPLILSTSLSFLAELKVVDMAQSDYFDHVSPVFGTPMEMVQAYGGDVSCRAVSENIVWLKDGVSVRKAHGALMGSSTHKATLLDTHFNRVGIGVLVVGDEMWVSQLFCDTGEVY